MTPLCIYHGGCDDGFGAAWAVWSALKGEVELYAGKYQTMPPIERAADRDVYLVDFSYKHADMLYLEGICRTVTVLDHHETAQDQLEPLLRKGMIGGEFDMNRSGAMLTWDWFNPGDPPPMLIKYIQDRDLWRKELPHSDEVIMALRSYPQDIDTWNQLMEQSQTALGCHQLMEEGRSIVRYYRTLVDEAKRRVQFRRFRGGQEAIPTVNAPHFLASEVAGEICEEHGTEWAACWWVGADGTITYSLRSRGDFHVGRYAEEHYGGGGHKNAAGFRMVEGDLF